jgi:hypothetical protein
VLDFNALVTSNIIQSPRQQGAVEGKEWIKIANLLLSVQETAKN